MKEFDTKFDNFLRENIGRIDECCPSDDFVDNVMVCCTNYETAKAERILRIKKYSLALIPLLIIGIIVFVPGLIGFLLTLLSKITLIGMLKYYAYSSIIVLTSMYLFLSERIVKFVKNFNYNQHYQDQLLTINKNQ